MNRHDKVRVFNEIMGQTIPDNHREASVENVKLGLSLIFEELKELAEAGDLNIIKHFKDLCISAVYNIDGKLDNNRYKDKIDPIEQLDALCDVAYTTNWAVNMLGFSEKFEEAFEEVCQSNNSKACTTMEEAKETVDYYMERNDTESTIVPIGKYYVVKRVSDGKVLKNVNYKPAELKYFV